MPLFSVITFAMRSFSFPDKAAKGPSSILYLDRIRLNIVPSPVSLNEVLPRVPKLALSPSYVRPLDLQPTIKMRHHVLLFIWS